METSSSAANTAGLARKSRLTEILFGETLLAPVLMLFHAKFVVSILLGSGVKWVTQNRESGDAINWREAWERGCCC